MIYVKFKDLESLNQNFIFNHNFHKVNLCGIFLDSGLPVYPECSGVEFAAGRSASNLIWIPFSRE